MSIYPSSYPYPYSPYLPPHVTSEEGPAPERPRGLWPTRFAAIFGGVVILVTLLAVALAVLAPFTLSSPASTIPAGWNKVYDAAPTGGSAWDRAEGCAYSSAGLHITGSDVKYGCLFTPSRSTDLTGEGILIEATVAPAADVTGNQDAGIVLSTAPHAVAAFVDQSGEYRLCVDSCMRASDHYISGVSVAWHGNGYTANIIGLRYLPDVQTLTLFLNGQEVTSLFVERLEAADILLDATRSSEALFTHVTIYSPRQPLITAHLPDRTP